MNPADPADAIAHLAPRLRPILRRARALGAFINFDMESYAHKNTTLELFRTLFMESEFRDWPHAGIVVQAYLRDAELDLQDLIAWGRARGTRFAVRLVKGAYWDYEKIKADQNGWPCPVFLQKPESDANFEALTAILLENESIVTAAFGSHNVRSIAHAMSYAEKIGVEKSRFEFQLLYGMAGPIKRALVEMGYRVREYCPVGELLPGMSYLVRRLLENTSNEGFLRAKFSENVSAAQLLRDPNELVVRPALPTPPAMEDRPSPDGASHEGSPGDTYKNSPLVNFVYKESQEQMQAALRDIRSRFGQKFPLVINGEKIWTDTLTPSINPSAPDQIVGYAAEAGIPEAERAVSVALAAFKTWGRTPVETRAQLLERVAVILNRRRYEISALEVFEVGKAMGRGRCRCSRGDRFLPLLRAPNAVDWPAASHPGSARRGELSTLLAARRCPCHRAVEFPAGDPMRNGFGRFGHRQHRDHETVRAIALHRRVAHGSFRGSRCATRSVEFPAMATARSSAPTWWTIRMSI